VTDVPLGLSQQGWRWGWLFAAIWLVYLVDPLRDAATADSWLSRAAVVTAVVVFAVLYVRAWVVSRRGAPARAPSRRPD